jgi:tetratricopeptide (TPR) repeat protein
MKRIAFAAVALCLSACTDYSLMRAESAYKQERYLEVAEELAQREQEAPDLPRRDRARYGTLYGLALLRLGDHEGAERWLRFAKETDDNHLNPQLRQALAAGWAELEQVTKP